MSLYGALFSGVSGLQSQSSAMGAIADNVTNVNTTGYKRTEVQFQTLVTKQVSLTAYAPGGVQSKPRAGIDVQGLLQSTTSATDIAISGDGMFIVNEAPQPESGDIFAYTRAGSFKVDKDGYLQNASGWYLQGWPLLTWDNSTQASTVTVGDDVYMKAYKNDSGDTVYSNDNIVDGTNLKPLNLNTIGGTATATTTVSMGLNLPAGDDPGDTHKTDVQFFDSLGNPHNLNHNWVKRASNSWDYYVIPPAGSKNFVIEDQNSARNNYYSAGRLDFETIPDSGTSMTMAVDGTTYTIQFTTADDDDVAEQTIDIGAVPADGEYFEMAIDGTTYFFEFDNNDSVTAGRTPVTIGSGGVTTATTTTVAGNLAAALQSKATSVIGTTTWATSSGTQITFNQTNAYTITFTDQTTGDTTVNAAGAVDTTIGINVSSRSLSQIMDELAERVQAIMHYEWAGTPSAPPNLWAERLAGENAVYFMQGSTSTDVTVDASGLTTNGVASVMQKTSYTMEKLDASYAWITSNVHAVEFNGDGTPDKFFETDESTASNPRAQYKISWANGASDMDGSSTPALSVGLGNYNTTDGVTQFSGSYQINYISQNGASFGNFAGVSVGQDGIVTALFDNGVTKPAFMIPVATLVNPNGMESRTGNVWIETDGSGQPTVREAGAGGAGSIASAALEASTVDIGEEFTNMITTQRAYSASTKIISTADEMLEELMRVK